MIAVHCSAPTLRGKVVDAPDKRVTDPAELADLAGYSGYLSDEQKRELLETPDVEVRLNLVVEWARAQLAELEVTDKIADDVREGMDKTQREFLLRQQLAAIRKELGEGEPDGSDDYRARVEAAELPEKVLAAAPRRSGQAGAGLRLRSPEAEAGSAPG